MPECTSSPLTWWGQFADGLGDCNQRILIDRIFTGQPRQQVPSGRPIKTPCMPVSGCWRWRRAWPGRGQCCRYRRPQVRRTGRPAGPRAVDHLGRRGCRRGPYVRKAAQDDRDALTTLTAVLCRGSQLALVHRRHSGLPSARRELFQLTQDPPGFRPKSTPASSAEERQPHIPTGPC